MVVKLMRWPSWPPFSSTKFEVGIVLQRLEGLKMLSINQVSRLIVEINWKGQKGIALGSLIRSVKRNSTGEGAVSDDGSVVEWFEGFRNLCTLSASKDFASNIWEVAFTVSQKCKLQGPSSKSTVIGTASLNLAAYVTAADGNVIPINIPLKLHGRTPAISPSLCLSLIMKELRTAEQSSKMAQRSITPLIMSPPSAVALSREKDETSAIKSGLERVRLFRDCVSARRYGKEDDVDFNCQFSTDTLDGGVDEEAEEHKTFGYETLACANFPGGSSFSNVTIDSEDEFLIYYGNETECLCVENLNTAVSDQNLKRKILAWRKRKLSFKSSKNKGEPLLNKRYGEEGGDDIDFYRRQLSSTDESSYGGSKTEDPWVSEFGDDHFLVGSWERKEFTSRDGRLKLKTEIFFASIDQRSERAAGESACTALVAVIADWLQSNRDQMPIKSEYDSLIREGSSEWRILCEKNDYIERFPDKHFDLDTIMEAKVRPLAVIPDKSFVGFFQPERLGEKGFDFLQGAMSFDSIWDEIGRLALDCNGDHLIYIISWNDHFFILKVEEDSYYIVDTLGERLYEGCNQAYILKFDKETTIKILSDKKPLADKAQEEPGSGDGDREDVVCTGKESCRVYIKSFLAAIPIRELETDIKKGLIASTPLHHRLQIEFHHTQLLEPVDEILSKEATGSENSVNEGMGESPSLYTQ